MRTISIFRSHRHLIIFTILGGFSRPFCPVTTHWQTHWQATHTPTSPFCHTLRYPARFSIFHTLLAVSIFYPIYTPLYPPRSPFFGPGDAYHPFLFTTETLFLLPPFYPFYPGGAIYLGAFYYTQPTRRLYAGYTEAIRRLYPGYTEAIRRLHAGYTLGIGVYTGIGGVFRGFRGMGAIRGYLGVFRGYSGGMETNPRLIGG